MKTVQLEGRDIRLKLPKSFTLRNEIATAAINNLHRACGAALGICWTGPGRPAARYESTYSPLVFGGAVIDELCADRGLGWPDVFAAGVAASTLIADSLPREDEVSRIEGNSEASPPPSGEAPNPIAAETVAV